MTDPERPVRVLLQGASTVTWTPRNAVGRRDLGTGRRMEEFLEQHVRRADVRVVARLGQPQRAMLRDWEEHVLQWSPDAVVMAPVTLEVLHPVLPYWFERLANQPHRPPGLWHDLWYRRVVRAAWRTLGAAQARIDARCGTALLRRRLRAAVADVERYIEVTRLASDVPFLLVELVPAVGSIAHWHPGQPERVAQVNAALRDLASRLPGVETVDLTPALDASAAMDPAGALPDGIHYSAAAHRAVAELVGALVLDRVRAHRAAASTAWSAGD